VGIPILVALLSLAGPSAFAQDEARDMSVARLEQEFSDPLTTLPQLFTQDAYTPVNYGINSSTNRVIARVIVPRLPKYSLFPFVQLVRPSFSLVTVPTGRGGTRTEFGDMQLFDLAVIPWPGRETGLLMGVGPVFVFPTATDRLVGQGAWQQQLENNTLAFTAEFVRRARFTAALPISMSPSDFVTRLFINAGVLPTLADRQAAINEFGSAITTSDVAARARALRDVADNSTLKQQEFNRAFVLMQFLGYLRRNPNDAPDADYTGYDFWLTKLNQFNGNFVAAEMVKAFIVSAEYRQRFGS